MRKNASGDAIVVFGARAYQPDNPNLYIEPMGGKVRTGKMARARLHRIALLAQMLNDAITSEDEIPAWTYDLIAVAYDKLQSAHGYIEPRSAGVF